MIVDDLAMFRCLVLVFENIDEIGFTFLFFYLGCVLKIYFDVGCPLHKVLFLRPFLDLYDVCRF